jgi:hypothetical protein
MPHFVPYPFYKKNGKKNGAIRIAPINAELPDGSATDPSKSSAMQFTRNAEKAPKAIQRFARYNKSRASRFSGGGTKINGLIISQTPGCASEYLIQTHNRLLKMNQPANIIEKSTITFLPARPGLANAIRNIASNAMLRRTAGMKLPATQ